MIKNRSSTAAFLAIVVTAAACATTTSSQSTSASRDIVTGAELVETNTRDLYSALERLRPNWLSSRGPAGMSNVRDVGEAVANVYINGNHMGTIEFLRQYYVSDVHEVRYWDAGEAGARFGMGNPRGVIEIIPRR